MRISANKTRKAPTSGSGDDVIGGAIVRLQERLERVEQANVLPKGFALREDNGRLFLVDLKRRKKAELILDWTDLDG